jgi:hypothetical protein
MTAIQRDRDAPLSQLASRLGQAFRSNKYARQGLLNLLGVIGILEAGERKGYFDAFVPADEREARRRPGKHDWEYPVQWWNGSYGIRRDAFDSYFGDYDILG